MSILSKIALSAVLVGLTVPAMAQGNAPAATTAAVDAKPAISQPAAAPVVNVHPLLNKAAVATTTAPAAPATQAAAVTAKPAAPKPAVTTSAAKAATTTTTPPVTSQTTAPVVKTN